MTLEEKAALYHEQNPMVGVLFVKFALDKMRGGFAHYSAYAVMHRVRWETDAGDAVKGDGFKIDNNHVPFYARAFNKQFETDFFRTRERWAD